MSTTDYLVDTNILIYHTKGSQKTKDFISRLIVDDAFFVSILTKIEFLGWDKHTPEGFEKCKRFLETATVFPVDDEIATRAIELRRTLSIKLADAVIAATALINGLRLATRNVSDFKKIKGLEVTNPFE